MKQNTPKHGTKRLGQGDEAVIVKQRDTHWDTREVKVGILVVEIRKFCLVRSFCLQFYIFRNCRGSHFLFTYKFWNKILISSGRGMPYFAQGGAFHTLFIQGEGKGTASLL